MGQSFTPQRGSFCQEFAPSTIRCCLFCEESKKWIDVKYLLTCRQTNIVGVGVSIATLMYLVEMARTQRKWAMPVEDQLVAAYMARLA